MPRRSRAITSFEAQVAAPDRRARRGGGDGRDPDRPARRSRSRRMPRLITEQEALNLALARARDEIDAQAEAARLAAARREALEAMIADLQSHGGRCATRSLADALARSSLRRREASLSRRARRGGDAESLAGGGAGRGSRRRPKAQTSLAERMAELERRDRARADEVAALASPPRSGGRPTSRARKRLRGRRRSAAAVGPRIARSTTRSQEAAGWPRRRAGALREVRRSRALRRGGGAARRDGRGRGPARTAGRCRNARSPRRRPPGLPMPRRPRRCANGCTNWPKTRPGSRGRLAGCEAAAQARAKRTLADAGRRRGARDG